MGSPYAKAIVAAIGAAATAALAIFPAGTTIWNILTVIAALGTVLGVYVVPNKTPEPTPPTKK